MMNSKSSRIDTQQAPSMPLLAVGDVEVLQLRQRPPLSMWHLCADGPVLGQVVEGVLEPPLLPTETRANVENV